MLKQETKTTKKTTRTRSKTVAKPAGEAPADTQAGTTREKVATRKATSKKKTTRKTATRKKTYRISPKTDSSGLNTGDMRKALAKPRPDARVEEPPAPVMTPEERHRMIAERAYHKSQRRGWGVGNPQQDWYEAETEVDAWLAKRQTQRED